MLVIAILLFLLVGLLTKLQESTLYQIISGVLIVFMIGSLIFVSRQLEYVEESSHKPLLAINVDSRSKTPVGDFYVAKIIGEKGEVEYVYAIDSTVKIESNVSIDYSSEYKIPELRVTKTKANNKYFWLSFGIAKYQSTNETTKTILLPYNYEIPTIESDIFNKILHATVNSNEIVITH